MGLTLERIDEYVSQEEYDRRRRSLFDITHHLRFELSTEKVKLLKQRSDEFISVWGSKLLDGSPDYWLRGGSTGGFTFVTKHKG